MLDLRPLALPLCVACGGDTALTVAPATIAWGEVDFLEEMPANGYDEVELTLTNDGDKPLTARFTAFDFDHLCAVGWEWDRVPADLPELQAGEVYSLFVGVCAYDAALDGLGIEISGEITFEAGETVAVPWSFTPVKGATDDTGE